MKTNAELNDMKSWLALAGRWAWAVARTRTGTHCGDRHFPAPGNASLTPVGWEEISVTPTIVSNGVRVRLPAPVGTLFFRLARR